MLITLSIEFFTIATNDFGVYCNMLKNLDSIGLLSIHLMAPRPFRTMASPINAFQSSLCLAIVLQFLMPNSLLLRYGVISPMPNPQPGGPGSYNSSLFQFFINLPNVLTELRDKDLFLNMKLRKNNKIQ